MNFFSYFISSSLGSFCSLCPKNNVRPRRALCKSSKLLKKPSSFWSIIPQVTPAKSLLSLNGYFRSSNSTVSRMISECAAMANPTGWWTMRSSNGIDVRSVCLSMPRTTPITSG